MTLNAGLVVLRYGNIDDIVTKSYLLKTLKTSYTMISENLNDS